MKNLSGKFSAFVEGKLITVPFYSDSEFSMHELLEFLLLHSGPARVSISSFSVSEIALRSFVRLCENGSITHLRCLLDISVRRHRLGLLFFAAHIVSEIGLAKNHAKIILIKNQACRWVVVGSANLNLNDKIEAGIVSRDPALVAFFDLHFDNSFSKSLKVTADEFNR